MTTSSPPSRYFLQQMAPASLVVAFLLCAAGRAEITRILAFGDSFTDTGNLFIASGGLVNAPPYWEGRASNGPVWIEYLADLLEVPRPVASRLGGTNWAVGGAPTGQGSFIETRNPPFGDLPSDIEIRIPRLGMQIDEMLASHTLSEDDLVVVWAFNDFDPNLPGGARSPEQIVANLSDHVARLQQAGATNFLLPNVHNGTPAHAAFNSLWQAQVRELRETLPASFYFLNFGGVVSDVVSRRAEFGFNNDTSPIINRPVANPDEYTNWDGVHITTAFHRIVADGALDALRQVDGDLNDNGVVEQGDLDLVLLNWGEVGRPAPRGWINNLPNRLIDQEELDRVLTNWGRESLVPPAQLSHAAVPEPSSSLLLIAALACSALSKSAGTGKWKR